MPGPERLFSGLAQESEVFSLNLPTLKPYDFLHPSVQEKARWLMTIAPEPKRDQDWNYLLQIIQAKYHPSYLPQTWDQLSQMRAIYERRYELGIHIPDCQEEAESFWQGCTLPFSDEVLIPLVFTNVSLSPVNGTYQREKMYAIKAEEAWQILARKKPDVVYYLMETREDQFQENRLLLFRSKFCHLIKI